MREIYLTNARKELTEYIVYHKLALKEKKPANRELLEKLSAQEKSHYEFWKTLLPGENPKPYLLAVYGTPLLRTFFGVTFTTKFLETHEKDAVRNYMQVLQNIPETHREGLRNIIEDEKTHERSLIGELKEKRVAYVGFIALGLADAIVEITGVHAGFLGVTGQTLIAGVSGIIVGFAAAISMGSAAYLQAKQDPEKNAVASAFITGITYICSVVVLALPYFFISEMLPAFLASTGVGILLLAMFTFFSAVVFDKKFWGELAESVGLMLGTAIATYLLGTVISDVFHISGKSF